MKVTRVEVFMVGRDWNNLVIARAHTDSGVSGLGEGTMQWQARTVAAAIEHMASRYVLGASPFEIERVVQAMYRNEYARGGPVLNSAIAAIEFALWDICGKVLDQPVYNLLGGRVHDAIPAYANGWFDADGDADQAAAAARRVVQAGYKGLKFDPFWGLGRDPDLADLRRGVEAVSAVRAAVGPDVKIMVDGHGRFSVGTASRLAHALAENGVYWFEEPVEPENYLALGEVARPAGLQIAAGERCYSRYQTPLLLRFGKPHVLQPDPIQVGGLLEAKKIAALADTSYLPVSFHCPFGPIAEAAILQLNAATTNIVCQESFSEFDVGWRSELISHCPKPVGGSYAVSGLPGLGGIELNEAVVREYPYRDGAVQSMWTVNGSMLGPEANVAATRGENPPAAPRTSGSSDPVHKEETRYEDANEA
ncbi:MAG: mandelate racemase/muconate lactonizing enzyme family protein [Hyphomicrobiales bacterium]|nr:mandelate racemase/muconate lactonizing enzyme family protein [Hyphomicrobiales bacterium]